MNKEQIKNLLDSQRKYFLSGATLDVDFRLVQLEKLKSNFVKYEPQILEAVKKDMGRNEMETYLIELGWVMDELNNTIKNLKDWTKDQHVKTPANFAANESIIKPQPLGTVFILSAWNFPNWQIFGPLLGAIAAGNTAVVKPSSDAPACGVVINEIVEATFSPNYVKCILGDVELINRVLDERFDLIFFTGSPRVGKIIQALVARLDEITTRPNAKNEPKKDTFLDNQEFLILMKISKRTAQIWRDEGRISFSQVGNKIYYKLSDVEKLLNEHYNKSFAKK
ncbi:aldehyde dehydrogenase family protein [Epilithonimonas sp. JDS]|nr:aldehyde dehydrogenase family protein [Epilithonimonas sp. JDS]